MKLKFIVRLAIAIQILFASLLPSAVTCGEEVLVDRHLRRYASGIVHDTRTGLEWYAGPDRAMTWEAARRLTDRLDAFGGGWRMPTLKELDALRAISDGIDTITPFFANTGYWIWAGQTPESSSRWVFGFSYGGEGWGGQAPDDGGRVIAVRPGKR